MRQRAAGVCARLRIDLDAAGVFKDVHRQERLGNRLAHGEQAVVAQHQVVRVAQIRLQARLVLVAEGHAFIVVISQ